MLIENLATRLERARCGDAPIVWSDRERELSIIRDIAGYIEAIVDGNLHDVPERLHDLSFWLWSLCRHHHWRDDSPAHFVCEMSSMETRELSLCTGLLSLGVALGGGWPAPWPDLLDETQDALLIQLLQSDRARLEGLGRSVRENHLLSSRMKYVAIRLRSAIDSGAL